MSKPKSEKSLLPIALSLLAIVLLALALLLNNQTDGKAEYFFARSIDDASYDCEDKIRAQFGKNLINSSYDQISSRYDASKRQYIIYYYLTIAELVDDLPTVRDRMAKCVVWERLGYVSDYTVFEI